MITNVYQRKDGRFEGRITIDRIDGKRPYKAFFGRTPDDVITKMADYRTRMAEAVSVSMKFSDVFEEWFQSISIRIKDSTLANYILKAEKHILPVYANDDITDIKQSNIYQFIKKKQDSGLSNRYITDILVLMKSVFKYAVRTYRIFNPMEGLVMPKKEKTEIRLLTEAEEKRLMEIVMANQKTVILPLSAISSCNFLVAIMYSQLFNFYQLSTQNLESGRFLSFTK